MEGKGEWRKKIRKEKWGKGKKGGKCFFRLSFVDEYLCRHMFDFLSAYIWIKTYSFFHVSRRIECSSGEIRLNENVYVGKKNVGTDKNSRSISFFLFVNFLYWKSLKFAIEINGGSSSNTQYGAEKLVSIEQEYLRLCMEAFLQGQDL